MAEKLMKPSRRKVAPKKKIAQPKQTGAIILVGTYKKGQLPWIGEHNIYNYPITDKDELKPESSGNVKELWLYAGSKSERTVFAAKFVGVRTSEEFLAENPSYAKLGKTHHAKYLVFKTKPLDYCSRLEDATVIARARDFARSMKKIAAAVKEFQNNGDFTSLADVLPAELAALPRNQLRVCDPTVQLDFFKGLGFSVPFPPPENPKFTFIDLFAGVGGFRIAMQNCGGKCVFSSEWDKAAQQTYTANYGEVPFGDITKEETKNAIPRKFDVLCAGFPCQPFSLAGVSARVATNKQHGFNDKTQGTLFFDVLQIIRTHRPRVVFLENVRNLVNHDHGRTFKIIRDSIEELGYSFNFKVIDASSIVPQKRLRCYMVCVRNNGDYNFPDITGEEKPLSSILEQDVSESFTISDNLWAGHQRRTKNNIQRGAGFTAFTADVTKPSRTLVARYYKDGKECLIPQKGKNPRMLTPRECARLQGFPESFSLPKSRSAAYKQMGNSVVVPVLARIANNIVRDVLKIKEC